jgi:hypothetical protein
MSDPTNILSQCTEETFRAFAKSMEPAREGENIYEIVSDERVYVSIDEIMNGL